MAKRGLGKGLDALYWDDTAQSASMQQMVRISELETNEGQPRSEFNAEALGELAESIRLHGILQPLAVRKLAEGKYQIIAGERRYRAARQVGLSELPVIVVDADDKTAAELALVENLQRADLNPIEEAQGYLTLIKRYGLTQEEVSDRVAKSRSAVANALRLLALDEAVRELLVSGEITSGHARALITLCAEKQTAAAEIILKRDLNVRQTEALVAKMQQEEKNEKKSKSGVEVNYLEAVERRLAEKLGRKVKLISGRRKGRVELEFYGNEDLEKLLLLLEKAVK